jgi:hypothetical protein
MVTSQASTLERAPFNELYEALDRRQRPGFAELARSSRLDYPPVRTYRDESDLITILREHAVPVYSPQSVTAYKKAKVQAFTSGNNKRSEKAILWAVPAGVIAIAAIALTVILNNNWFILGLCVGLIPGIKAATIFSGVVKAAWRTYALDSYRREIPLPVLRVADSLRLASDRIHFEVEELAIERKFDPLLFVKIGQARFCIAAWDEPDFTAQPLS